MEHSTDNMHTDSGCSKSLAVITTVLAVLLVVVLGIFAYLFIQKPAKVTNKEQEAETIGASIEAEPIKVDVAGHPDDGKDITEVKAAADETTFRKLLAEKGRFAIEVTEDLRIDKTLVVTGTKKVVGTKKVSMELYAEGFQSIFEVPMGATLILDGVVLDCNGIANGVTVKEGAGLTTLSGEILYPVPYGILNSGTAWILDIGIFDSMDTGICVQDQSKLYMDGGKILRAQQRGIYIPTGGYAKIGGNTLIEESLYCIRTGGICEMTGGTLRNAGQCLVYAGGSFTVDYQGKSAEDKLEWSGSKGECGVRIGGEAVATLKGLYVHSVRGRGIRLVNYKSVTIENCEVADTGHYGLETYNGKEGLTIRNVQIHGTKASALRAYGATRIQAENLEIADVVGFGIKNETSILSAKHVKITNTSKNAVNGMPTSKTEITDLNITSPGENGVTCDKATVKIQNAVISQAGKAGIVTKRAGAVAELIDVKVLNPAERGLYNIGGTVKAKKLQIQSPGLYGVTTNRTTSQEESRGNVTIEDLKVTDVRKNDAVSCYYSTMSLTEAKLEQVCEIGVRVGKGGTLTMQDVQIANCGLRAVASLGGKVTAQNLRINNPGDYGVTSTLTDGNEGVVSVTDLTLCGAKLNALNSNGGTLRVTTANIEETAANGVYAEKKAQVSLKNVTFAKCGKRGIYIKDDGTKATLTDVTIKNTTENAVAVATKAHMNVSNMTVKDSLSNGLVVMNATFTGKKVRVSDAKEYGAYFLTNDNEGNTFVSSVEIDGLVVQNAGNRGIHNQGSISKLKSVEVTSATTISVAATTSGNWKGCLSIDGIHIDGRNKKGKVVATGNALNCNGSELIVKNSKQKGIISYVDANGAYVENGGQLTLENSDIIHCKSRGVYANSENTKMTLKQIAFSEIGGASTISVSKGTNLTAEDISITEFRDGQYGIFVQGTAVIGGANTNISGNLYAMEGSTSSIPAIAVDGGMLTICDGTYNGNPKELSEDKTPLSHIFVKNGGELLVEGGNFTDHTASAGGVIYNLGTVEIRGGIFSGNTATSRGGVIYGVNPSGGTSMTIISGGIFTSNVASGTIGGGVFSGAANTKMQVRGGVFSKNQALSSASNAYGGGVIETNGNVTISGGIFEDNKGILKGGAIYIDSAGTLSIETGTDGKSAVFRKNEAENGGAVYNKGQLQIDGGTFGGETADKGNRAGKRGGVIYNDATVGEAIIKNADFRNNQLTSDSTSGGAIYVGKNTTIVTDCTFRDNVVGKNGSYGGAIMVVGDAAASLQIKNSLFTGNQAAYGGAIAFGGNSSSTMSDCVFLNNQGSKEAPDIRLAGKLSVHGLIVAEIRCTNVNLLTVAKALTTKDGLASNLQLAYPSTTSASRTLGGFASDAVMNESKPYIELADSMKGTWTLTLSSNKIMINKK